MARTRPRESGRPRLSPRVSTEGMDAELPRHDDVAWPESRSQRRLISPQRRNELSNHGLLRPKIRWHEPRVQTVSGRQRHGDGSGVALHVTTLRTAIQAAVNATSAIATSG